MRVEEQVHMDLLKNILFFNKMEEIILKCEKYFSKDMLSTFSIYTSEMPDDILSLVKKPLLVYRLTRGINRMDAAAYISELTVSEMQYADLVYNIGRDTIVNIRDPLVYHQNGEKCLYIMFDRSKHLNRCFMNETYSGCFISYNSDEDIFTLRFKYSNLIVK